MKRKIQAVPPAAWIAALLEPGVTVRVDLKGFPFRFAPPPDWDTQEQRLPQHLIYGIVRGRCRATLDGRSRALTTGDLCWVGPGVPFRVRAAEAGTVLQRFRLEVVRRKRTLGLPWRVRVFAGAFEAAERGRELVADAGGSAFASRRTACLAALFSMAVFAPAPSGFSREGLPEDICRRLNGSVWEDGNFRLTIREMAALAGLSPDYFTRQFRRSFGLPPRQWILRQRLRQASILLAETAERVSGIAARLGYSEVYLFSRQFAAEFGVSPRAWRQRHRLPPAV